MEQAGKKLSDGLITALVTHIYIGWGLLYLVKLATLHLNHNAYWGMLIALLIITPFYWIIYQLAKTYPGQSIAQIFGRVFGKVFGTNLVIMMLLHIAYFQIIFFRDGQLMIYTYFFKNTPFILMTGVFIAGILYISWRGAESVGRLALFMLIPPFLVILGLQLLGLTNVNPINLRPVFEGSLRDWFMAGTDLVIILLPGTGISICLPFFKKPDTMRKITIYSLGMVIPLFFLNILGIIGTFGPSVMNKLNWPAVVYFHVIDYPFLLLEQAGLFFLIAWYPTLFITLGMGACFVSNEFHIIFPRIKREWFTLVYCVVLWILVNIPINMLASETFFKHTYKWFAFSFLSFLLVTWLVARIRFKS